MAVDKEAKRRKDEIIFERMRKTLREGVRDGSIHFNPPGSEYMADVFPPGEDEQRPARPPKPVQPPVPPEK